MYTAKDYERDKLLSISGSSAECSMAELRCIHYEHGRIAEADRLLQQSPYRNEPVIVNNTCEVHTDEYIANLEKRIKYLNGRCNEIRNELCRHNESEKEFLMAKIRKFEAEIRTINEMIELRKKENDAPRIFNDMIIDMEYDLKNLNSRRDDLRYILTGNISDDQKEIVRQQLREVNKKIRELEDELTRKKLGY